MASILYRLYPELRQLPHGDRDVALRRARREPFDFVELLGIAAGLVLVAFLGRSGHLGAAATLVALALAAFDVRRVRRGLRLGARRVRGAR
jgi:hypothetical protein